MEPAFPSSSLNWLATNEINWAFDLFAAERPVAAAAGALILAAALYWGRFVASPSWAQRAPRRHWLMEALAAPSFVMLASAAIERGLFAAGFASGALYVDIAGALLALALAVWAAGRGVELLFWKGIVEARTGYEAPLLLRLLGYALLGALALALVLWRSGYSPSGLLISTGVVAAGLAIALQRSLGDAFAGLALSVERAYDIGDWIELPTGEHGKVIDVTWRATKVLSFQNSVITMPNSALAAGKIHNFSARPRVYADWFTFHLPAEVDPRAAKRLLLDAIVKSRFVLRDPAPNVRLVDAGTTPYRYSAYVYFADYLAMYRGRDAMMVEVDAALRRVGVRPSAPMQEVQIGRRGGVALSQPALIDILCAAEFFSPLGGDELKRLADRARIETLEPGAKPMVQGERVRAIHVVWNGVLRETFRAPDGTAAPLGDLTAGASFGQISVVTGEPALVSVEAVTECVLVALEPDILRPIVEANPDLAEEFARAVAARMGNVGRARAAFDTGREGGLPRSIRELRARIERVLLGGRAGADPGGD